MRPHLKMSGISYRVDETYIKVGKMCKYLYRVIDKEGQTIEGRIVEIEPDQMKAAQPASGVVASERRLSPSGVSEKRFPSSS